MSIIKKENKKFNYKPRYYKGEDNPYKIKYKFDKFRTTVGKNKSLKNKFELAFNELKNSNFRLNKKIFFIAIILFLIFFFIIDFDFSIFLPKN